MTIEYEVLETGARKLADHRIFEDKRNPAEYRGFRPVPPISVFESIQDLENLGSEFVLAYPVDPDTIEFRRIKTGTFGQIPIVDTIGTITKEAINFANITDGKLKIVWHPTGPEDYPPPPEGYTVVENP